MLALTRKTGQSIIIDDNIEITVVEVKGDQVRVGISAPRSVKILRKEIFEEIRAENKAAAGVSQIPGDNLEILVQNLPGSKIIKNDR
ncbi:carbon storage regulator CsrA [Phosphitispora fastidiosa]|uniref:carbon storage regulator CsrA n=1 Tax=Phosphitispora fastidiosa TaxID=2837202 RepID=UPI001E64C649|nr:carbon storage regulator CsrA [Phosphitispora fastidiosa]MBU7006410.1 carbon storage regulator [Phosphitispora fastidiosa]